MSFNMMPPALSFQTSSQESDLGDDDLLKLIEESELMNSRKNTNWGLTKMVRKEKLLMLKN